LNKKLKIGFICTENSARSQIAEAYAKYFTKLYKKNIEVYSAGSNPSSHIHPFTFKVLKEEGLYVKDQFPKSLEQIPYKDLDLIITLCEKASQNCPYIPNAKFEHWNLPDPTKESDPKKQLQIFRKIRDIIKKKTDELIKSLPD